MLVVLLNLRPNQFLHIQLELHFVTFFASFAVLHLRGDIFFDFSSSVFVLTCEIYYFIHSLSLKGRGDTKTRDPVRCRLQQ